MKMFYSSFTRMSHLSSIMILAVIVTNSFKSDARVVDIGPQLPDLLKDHPDKGWLIKFYAPWCHHCKQLEPTYSNVADRIHQQLNDLIVGRVDCTKYSQTCQQFKVDSFPTINYLRKDTLINYRGDRSFGSLVSFAERMNGPDIRDASSCNHLMSLAHDHGLIIVMSDPSKASGEILDAFRSLANSMKASHWFYQISNSCNGLTEPGKMYIMKRHLKQAILIGNHPADVNQLIQAMVQRINRESQPVFGPLNSMNFDRTMALNRTTFLAFVDEYKPAKKFTPSSTELYNITEQLAIEHAHNNHDLLFTWSSDVELIHSIVVDKIDIPNIVILRPDLSNFVALDKTSAKLSKEPLEKVLHPKLARVELLKLIKLYNSDRIKFGGGSFLDQILRTIFGYFMKLSRMYEANPLLCTLLIGLPSIILMFVIYTTCCVEAANYDRQDDEGRPLNAHRGGEDSDSDLDLAERSNNHAKQE